MFCLFQLNEDGSKVLLNYFDTLDEALAAAKMVEGQISIEQATETGSAVIV